MTNIKLILAAATTLGLATTAGAQVADQDATYDADTVAVDHFATSDLNADGGLDRAEFASFAALKAEEGDAAYVQLTETGEYDVEFMTRDRNADGLLDSDEIVVVTGTDVMDAEPVTEGEGMDEMGLPEG